MILRAITTNATRWLEDTTVNEVDIDGRNIYVIIERNIPNQNPQEKLFEAHQRYGDLHLCLNGRQRFDYQDTHSLIIQTPYNKKKDVILYQNPVQPVTTCILTPGDFAIVFPEDGHKAKLWVEPFDPAQSGTSTNLVVKFKV